MTKSQSMLYWRRWQIVCRANGWRMSQGRLVDVPEHATIRSQRHDQVKRIADDLASNQLRAVTIDDLRHACHVVAAGGDVSHKSIRPAAFDRLLILWRLLIYPDDLAATIEWDKPDVGERRRLTWRIRKAAPEAYIDEICRDRFGPRYNPPHWADLPTPCLRDLVRTLSARTRRWSSPIPQAVTHDEPAEPAQAGVDRPF